MKSLLISIFLCSFCFGIYIDKIEDLTRHQELASKQEFESVGFLYCDKSHYGTGTLIHPKIVLTAAHVVKKAKQIDFFLRLPNGEIKVVTGKAICHPNYEKYNKNLDGSISWENMPYDMALVFLTEEINGLNYPSLSINPPPEPCDFYTVGYGRWNGKPPKHLIDYKLAGITFVHKYNEQDTKFSLNCNNCFAIDLFATGRPGDSGGPLCTINNDTVIHGVFSGLIYKQTNELVKNEGDAIEGYYALIYKEIDWITTAIEENLELVQ